MLQQFQHGVLEGLSRRVAGVNSEAGALIAGAGPGVDTATLEQDQEALMDKWNTLNAKVTVINCVWFHKTKLENFQIIDFGEIFKSTFMSVYVFIL